MAQKRFVALALAASLATGAAFAQPLNIEDLSRYPAVSSVSMSVEGDMLVGLVLDPTRDGQERAAAMWDISGKLDPSKPLVPTKITPGNAKMRFVFAQAAKQGKSLWVGQQPWTGRLAGCGEGRVTGATKTFVTKVYMGDAQLKIGDLPGGTKERLNDDLQACFDMLTTTGIASPLIGDPEHVVLRRSTLRDGVRYYKHNLRTGREEFLYSDSGRLEIAGISAITGMPFAKSNVDVENGEYFVSWYLIDPRTGEFTEEAPLKFNAKDRFAVSVQERDEQTGKYYVVTDKMSDLSAIYMYDPVRDAFDPEPLVAHPEFSVTGLVFSERTRDLGQIIGFRYDGAVPTVYWIDPEFEAIQSGLEAAYPGHDVTIQDYNGDLSRILFVVESSTMPAAYFLLVDKQKVITVGAERPWIDPKTLRPTELVYYTARDGLRIPALLTLPKNLQPGQKARGGIILPHGGPWARDYADWFGASWPQFLASRGFVVLQPQYRGSEGFGRRLWLAGDGEWGQKMQDDKDDGAAWLVSQGYVDADKLAIFGYSYGGFAAMAAVVREDTPYRCAISGAGVSNLTRLGANWSETRLQRIFQGDTLKGMDPMQHAAKARIPILMFHGDRDVRVPLFHSVDFYNAIKDRQPKSELLIIEDKPHGFPWPEHNRIMYSALERYLSTTCGL